MARLLEGYLEHPQFYGPTSTAVFTLVLSGVPPEEAAERAKIELSSSQETEINLPFQPDLVIMDGRRSLIAGGPSQVIFSSP
jgi:hypothetical protein